MSTDGDVFRIVCVCTGNICRSPAAERLLSHFLGASFRVTSAGTHAMVGSPISAPMDELVASVGADPTAFSARALSERILRDADLVLGMSREHRSAAVELYPACVRRAFTLREFARLLQDVDTGALPDTPQQRAKAAVVAASGQRRMSSPESDNIEDPYRRSGAVYKRSFAAIHDAARQIAAVLTAEQSGSIS